MTIHDVLALSQSERVQFIEAVVESMAASSEAATLSDAQRQELDAHLDALRTDPDANLAWAMVKSRVIPNA